MSQRILVIGGSGQTGRQIVQKLLKRGFDVRILTHNTNFQQEQLSLNVSVVRGDITEADSVRVAMQDVTGCVIVVESDTSDHSNNSPQRVHYEGTRHVLAAAAEHQIHIVLITQIYITRPESQPEVRNIIYWRNLAEQAVRASALPYTIVRPSWLSNEPGEQKAISLEQGDTGSGQVSREDVAEVCVQALLISEAQGKTFEVYNGPGQPPVDWVEKFRSLKLDVQA